MEPTSNNPYEYRETPEPATAPKPPFKFEDGEFLYEVGKARLPKMWQKMLIFFTLLPLTLFLFLGLVPFSYLFLVFNAIKLAQWICPGHYYDSIATIGLVLFMLLIPFLFVLMFYMGYWMDIAMPRIQWRILRRHFGYTIATPKNAAPGHFLCIPRQLEKGIAKAFSLADDYGWIRIEENGIRFEGEHTKLFIPANMIAELGYNKQLAASEIAIQFAGLPPFSACILATYAGGLRVADIKEAAKDFHAKIESLAKPYLT